MSKNPRKNAYILAGGKSSRMGTDKGLMLLDGKPLVQHVINQLAPISKNIIIISKNIDYQIFGLEIIEDCIPGVGPAGGILTALEHTDTDLNAIVSCDTPFITTRAIEFIFENAGSHEITLPYHGGQLEPLMGVYAKKCLSKWRDLLANGQVKLQDLVAQFDLLKLNVDHHELFENNIFMNLNTREEFEKATKR